MDLRERNNGFLKFQTKRERKVKLGYKERLFLSSFDSIEEVFSYTFRAYILRPWEKHQQLVRTEFYRFFVTGAFQTTMKRGIPTISITLPITISDESPNVIIIPNKFSITIQNSILYFMNLLLYSSLTVCGLWFCLKSFFLLPLTLPAFSRLIHKNFQLVFTTLLII